LVRSPVAVAWRLDLHFAEIAAEILAILPWRELPLRRNSVDAVRVFPGELAEDGRSGRFLEYGQRFASDALSRKTAGAGISGLGYATTVSIGAGAITAEQELVLMSLEEVRSEIGIAR